MATKATGGVVGGTRRGNEILVMTKNELGTLARATTPLTKNNINIECFTAYEWGKEAAFRFVTDNNKKACDILRAEGFNVQESPVIMWHTDNVPGRLHAATTALAEARINTYCSYSTAQPNTPAQVVVFNTSDPDRTSEVLRRI